MNKIISCALLCWLLLGTGYGLANPSSHYCAANADYIQLGNSTSEVIAACGAPTHIQDKSQPDQSTQSQHPANTNAPKRIIWYYAGQYNSGFTLTFAGDKLIDIALDAHQ